MHVVGLPVVVGSGTELIGSGLLGQCRPVLTKVLLQAGQLLAIPLPLPLQRVPLQGRWRRDLRCVGVFLAHLSGRCPQVLSPEKPRARLICVVSSLASLRAASSASITCCCVVDPGKSIQLGWAGSGDEQGSRIRRTGLLMAASTSRTATSRGVCMRLFPGSC